MGATLVKRHSSSATVGKPRSWKRAMASSRCSRSHAGSGVDRPAAKASNSVRYRSVSVID